MSLGLIIIFVAFVIPFCFVHSLTQKYSYATIAGIVALAILIVWAGGYDGTQSGEDSSNPILISADAIAKSISDEISYAIFLISHIGTQSGGITATQF